MATKVSTHVVGSWFPSGYYGHYRSRVRTDFVNEYRQLAKPQPPTRFINRSSQPAAAHQFSLHDNRNSFMCDASYFAQGLGKKRHPERSATFDPEFIAWTPGKIKRNAGRPLTSTYRQDFRNEEINVQKLVKRPKTSFDGVPTTTYRTVHGPDSPNRDLINAMNNEALMLSAQSRQRQAKQKKSDRRETVASCLSWYRPRVPQATCHTNFDNIDIRPAQATDLNINNCATNVDSKPVDRSAAPVGKDPPPVPVAAPVLAVSE
ncbi:uncharacterized protein LOC101849946 [Aplysia californica]|uniref:Uncharacterized protein LOC101849946 n=1 Tax=Aplysia californica TaxID=6500 RepID=A0ABM0JX66_APLCA|nr:uncharacterized protein LOC101849946 [Aplysia californica]